MKHKTKAHSSSSSSSSSSSNSTAATAAPLAAPHLEAHDPLARGECPLRHCRQVAAVQLRHAAARAELIELRFTARQERKEEEKQQPGPNLAPVLDPHPTIRHVSHIFP